MSKKLVILSILLIGLFFISAVSASDNFTNDIGDLKLNDDVLDNNQSQIDNNSNNSEVVNAEDKGKFAELENIITSGSGNIITLNKDYEYENTFKSNGITISKPLTIDGQGHIINCNNYHCYLFYSMKDDVTLKNLIIKNSNNNHNKIGGVIFIRSAAKWTIINCTFENNNAEDYGGVIYNNVDETLTIINSTFINNKAKNENGGAIFSKGDVVVEGSFFEGNSALVDAGAIYSEESVDITESEFINNKAWCKNSQVFWWSNVC